MSLRAIRFFGRPCFCVFLILWLSLLDGCRRPTTTAPTASTKSDITTSGSPTVVDRADNQGGGSESATGTVLSTVPNAQQTSKSSEALAVPMNSDSALVSGSNTLNEVDSVLAAASSAMVNPAPIPEGSWTKQRLIALTPKGPVLFDLMFRVGGQDLDAANAASVKPIIEDVLGHLGENNQWEQLFELPLIKSGWLGTLAAEEDNQLVQLVNLYDLNQDGLVQGDELTGFLTRGLSRSAAISVRDQGTEPNTDSTNSPFGPLDSDDDNVLSADELNNGRVVLSKLDIDSNSSISLAELSSSPIAPSALASGMGRAMMQTTSLVFHQPATSLDDKVERRQFQSKVKNVMEYFSFLSTIERQQWSGWNDSQWSLVDENRDGQINQTELAAVFKIAPAYEIAIDLPSPFQVEAETTWNFSDYYANAIWSADKRGGQLTSPLVDILFTVEDVLSNKFKAVLKSRLNESFKNNQVKQMLVQQLQLQETAFEVADADNSQTISDQEVDQVWRWLVARQTARIQGRWMMAAKPWFQLIDRDRDQVLSEVELSKIPNVLGRLDINQDALIDVGELPLVVRFQLSRQDQRLDPRMLQLASTDLAGGDADADWFAAMDTNRDDSIGIQEFLGSKAQFRELDSDGDGFISRSEVY